MKKIRRAPGCEELDIKGLNNSYFLRAYPEKVATVHPKNCPFFPQHIFFCLWLHLPQIMAIKVGGKRRQGKWEGKERRKKKIQQDKEIGHQVPSSMKSSIFLKKTFSQFSITLYEIQG